MFLGQYTHTIDDKGRLTIPVRFRDQLPNGGYIMSGFDNNLMVILPEHYERFCEQLALSSLTESRLRELNRSVFGQMFEIEVDKLGRILLPGSLRGQYNLQSEARIIGAGYYFEIWSPEAWAACRQCRYKPGMNSGRPARTGSACRRAAFRQAAGSEKISFSTSEANPCSG